MASSAPPPHGVGEGFGGAQGALPRRRPLGLVANAMKRKHGFVQMFLMTGILMLSLRSLGQKYRISDLSVDNAELRGERDALARRMAHLKDALRREADLDPSGALASQIRTLFHESE